jgi:plasmid stabilization system protein ParE
MSTPGPFEVRFADSALDDLNRLFEFILERARTTEDLDVAQHAVDEIRATCNGHLSKTPFSYRKSGESALRRELIIPFGSAGYVAQYEIEPALLRVIVLAVRHQREDDYH